MFSKRKKITYHFADGYEGKDYPATAIFDVGPFQNDPCAFSMPLCRQSAAMAISGFGANSGEPWSNAAEFLEKCGFKDLRPSHDYSLVCHARTIGCVFGRLKLGFRTTLVAASVRGGNYFGEWGGNFLLGREGDHEGFALAANKLLKELRDYCSDIKGKKYLWVTGFSRGGAVANLLACYCKEGFDKVFAYCFEAPMGAEKSRAAANPCPYIFNILDPDDLVPLLAPPEFGFCRYGVDMFYPNKLLYSEQPEAYLSHYRQMSTFRADPPAFEVLKADIIKRLFGKKQFPADPENSLVPSSLFLRESLPAFVLLMSHDRDDYVTNLQPGLVALGSLVGGQGDPYQTLFEFIKNICHDALQGINGVKNLIAGALGDAYLEENMRPLIEKRLTIEGKPLDKDALGKLSARIAKAIVSFALRQKDIVATFSSAETASYLLHVHSSSHTLSLVESADELYSCKWKRIHFAGDVEIELEDGSVLYPGHMAAYKNKKEATAYLVSGYKYAFKGNGTGNKLMIDGETITLDPSKPYSLEI